MHRIRTLAYDKHWIGMDYHYLMKNFALKKLLSGKSQKELEIISLNVYLCSGTYLPYGLQLLFLFNYI